jgi:hypothetical protein
MLLSGERSIGADNASDHASSPGGQSAYRREVIWLSCTTELLVYTYLIYPKIYHSDFAPYFLRSKDHELFGSMNGVNITCV